MIPHIWHLWLLQSAVSVLVSPKRHALFVPWKNNPEVSIPSPTSAFMLVLVTIIMNPQYVRSRNGRHLPVGMVLPHLVGCLEEFEDRSYNGLVLIWVFPSLVEELLD